MNAYIKQKVSLFRENFNDRHDYTGVENPVICPHCAKLQPWSYIPPKQHLTFISIALRIFMAACVLMVTLLPVILSSEDIDFGLPPIVIGIVSSLLGVPLYILIFLSVFQKNRARKKALKRLESEHFIFPEYYDETNMNELPDNKTVNTVNDEVQNIETVNTVSDEPQDIPERCILKIKEGSGIINYGTTFISMERHDTLRYTCSYCKHVQQFDYVLKKKARVKENELECYEILEHYYYPDAMNRAIACLNDKLTRKSEKLKYEVNTKHYLGSIDRSIVCPDCTRVQPWSKLSAVRKKVKKWLWITWGILTTLVIYLSPIFIKPSQEPLSLSTRTALLAAFFILYVLSPIAIVAADSAIKKKLKKMSEAMGTEHPTYDNLTNSQMPKVSRQNH